MKLLPLVALLLAATAHLPVAAQPAPAALDPLAAGFADPPMSARPRVWWHWMNGNISKDGIAKDLAWMKSVGLGGAQTFDANLATPQLVPKRLVYMQPDWQDAFRFAAREAERLGLELGIAASPGWSETGGPWVPPADGIKKLVWAETRVAPGRRFTGVLAPPPMATGPFQTLPYTDVLAAIEGKTPTAPPQAHGEVAVLAYPAPADPVPVFKVTTAAGEALDASRPEGSGASAPILVPRGTAANPGTVLLSADRPVTVRSATIFVPGARTIFSDPDLLPVLEVESDAGWRRLAALPLDAVPTTVSFAAATGRRFRVVLTPIEGPPRIGLGEGAPGAINPFSFGPPASDKVAIAELSLSPDTKVDRFETKAGFALALDYDAVDGKADAAAAAIPLARIVDLTPRIGADGTLDWTPPALPAGLVWRVLRFGWSLTGTTNHPATEEATGLEVDKLDGAAVRRYLDHYFDMYRAAAGPDLFGRRGVRAMVTDSTEVGAFNWTPQFIARFRERRGYDPTPWLPAMSGVVVESRARSDAFLFDVRRTIADLHASEHYATVAAAAKQNGLTLYGEALEDGRPSLGSDIALRANADVPMAAMWTWNRGNGPRPTLLGDLKGASSVAHLYGQNLAAAESLTAANSPWAYAPRDLKRVIDLEFAYGINRPVIHTSVHQPVDDHLPGLSLAIFGQYFNRHEAWASMARPWIDYIARSSFLLQQGRNVADIAYFFGEDAPLTAQYARAPLGDTPRRHAFDFVDADVLSKVLRVEDGMLVAPSGARYWALFLGRGARRMTLPTLQRIAALAEAGATVIGDAPAAPQGLVTEPGAFEALVSRLWSGNPRTVVGGGQVIAGHDADAALTATGAAPPFQWSGAADSDVLFVQRHIDDGEIFFLNNRRDRPEQGEARFAITGLVPSVWRAESGTMETVAYRRNGGATVVSLALLPEDALFVVFRKAAVRGLVAPVPALVSAATLDSPWTVAFQAGRGAPAATRMAPLTPLNENRVEGIRHFAGVATYSTRFTRPRGSKPGEPLWIDLGDVGDIAEVRVNGQAVGTVWTAPWRLDIGGAVRRGSNTLEIRVATTWVNRLIGDAQPGASKTTWTSLPSYRPDAPLRRSGLIGPVRLLRADTDGSAAASRH